MNRILIAGVAVALLAVTGCRHSSCSKNASTTNGFNKTMMPVSYPGAMQSMPLTTYPASYGNMIVTPTTMNGVPTVPFAPAAPGADTATELPFPGTAIPPTALPASPVGVAPPVTNPGAARSASLPK